ncbi:hypothetical protein [Desulforhopalus sp. 52FAK]
MIRNKQWCVLQRPEGGYLLTQVMSSKNTITFSPIQELASLPKDLGGSIHFTFTPEDYYLYTDTFPKLKPELLELQIKKRFSDLGIAMDPSRLLPKSKAIPGKSSSINSIFISQEDLDQNLSAISAMAGLRNCSLIPAAASIAGLIKTVTEKAVLIFLMGERFSHVLVVKNGVPIYNQSLAQTGPGQVEEALIPNAVDFARVTLRKDHDIDEINIVCLGKRRESIDLASLDIEEWHPDFSKAITTTETDYILRHPHLFGGYFAEPAYNFIPKEFRQIWKVQNFSRIVAITAGLTAVALLAGWFYFQPALKKQRSQYLTATTELKEKKDTIANRMPQTTMLNNFERLVNIRTKAKDDFRLDILAKDLSESLPSQVRVTELIIQRKTTQTNENVDLALTPDPAIPEDEPTDGSLSLPEKTQSKPFSMALTCHSTGSYSEVTTRFEKTAVALNDSFGVEDLTWSYREEDKVGTLYCNLFPQQRERSNEL